MSNKISAEDVKLLRDRTGAGMMDCKKALTESNGDFDQAIEFLKKKGQKISLSRADKNADEGGVFARVSENLKRGVLVGLACETDFVANTADFQDLGKKLASFAVNNPNVSTLEDLNNAFIDGRSVQDLIIELTGKVAEKIYIPAYKILNADCVVAYIHSGNRLGVLVGIDGASNVGSVGADIAMQIAAMNPLAVRLEDIDKSIVDKELALAKEKSQIPGKTEAMIEKIAQGMVAKILEQNALLSQSFVKDNSITVDQFLKKNLPGASISSFIRLLIG
jgi:elongation factor Ts